MLRTRSPRPIISLAALLVLGSQASALTYQFQALGTLGQDIAGSANSSVVGLSNSGLVAANSDAYNTAHQYLGQHAAIFDGTTLYDLGTLGSSTENTSASFAAAINNSGLIVGNSNQYNPAHVALGQTATTWQGLAPITAVPNVSSGPGAVSMALTTVNDNGVAAGNALVYNGSGSPLGYHIVRVQNNITTDLGAPSQDAGHHTNAQANGINNNGAIVGVTSNYSTGGTNGFVYHNGSYSLVPTLNASGTASNDSSTLTAINDAGQAIGSSEKFDSAGNDIGPHAIFYTLAGGIVDLGALPGMQDQSAAVSLNASGQVAGYSTQFDSTGGVVGSAGLYFDGTATHFFDFSNQGDGHDHTAASFIDAAGNVYGQFNNVDALGNTLSTTLFEWNPTRDQLTDLNALIQGGTSFQSLDSIVAVNASGEIAGNGTDGQGNPQGFVLNPISIPEPATLSLLAIGTLALIAKRKR